MTRLTVTVEVDDTGRPVFRLTPAQLLELGLEGNAALEARLEVEEVPRPPSPFRKYLGVAPKLPEGSVAYHRKLRGYDE